MRTFNSISPLFSTAAGELAIEKARLCPRPGISICTY